jgi:hypothetical protein
LIPVGRTGLVKCQYRGDKARPPRLRARLVTSRYPPHCERRFALHRRDHHWIG